MISRGSFQPQLFCVFYFMLRQLSGQASVVEVFQNKIRRQSGRNNPGPKGIFLLYVGYTVLDRRT